MNDAILVIQNRVKDVIDEKRYRHTIGVAHTAACMAMRYGIDPERAYLAGVLHDCAKGYPDAEYLKICEENHIDITDSERANPSLLHAKLGAFFAETTYGITDREILSSIRCHTTGKPDMTLLEKIIYIADYIEPGRNIPASNMDEIRYLAFTDIDNCLIIILKNISDYLLNSGKIIDNTTQETYDYYKRTVL